MFSKMLLFSTIIQLSGAANLLRQAAVQAKIERDRIKQRMPEAEPVTERRNRLNEAVLLSNTSSPCSSEFIATANEALSRSFTFFCAKYDGKALGNVKLPTSNDPLKALAKNCEPQDGANFAGNLVDVFSTALADEGKVETPDLISRNILSLVNSGSFSEARRYLGKLLRRVFVDLTTSDQLCDDSTSHKHRIRAYMEAQLTTTIDRISEQKFAALFQIAKSASSAPPVFLKSSSSGDSDSALAAQLSFLASAGCHVVFYSRADKAARPYALNSAEADCDLKLLYQVIAADVEPGTPLLFRSSNSTSISNLSWSDAVAALAHESDIELVFFLDSSVSGENLVALQNAAEYSGGHAHVVDSINIDELENFINLKIEPNRSPIYQKRGPGPHGILLDNQSSKQLVEVTCTGDLDGIFMDSVGDLMEYLVLESNGFFVFAPHIEMEEEIMIDDLILECDGVAEVSVSVKSSFSAFKKPSQKMPKRGLSRLSLSTKEPISDIRVIADDGDNARAFPVQIAPQFIEIGAGRDLAPGPAWAKMTMGSGIIRLKRASVKLFQLISDIDGLIMEPSEQLKIEFEAHNEFESYELSVASSKDDWSIFVLSKTTDEKLSKTSVILSAHAPGNLVGVDSNTVTLYAKKNGKIMDSFMIRLVADDTPEIAADLVEFNSVVIRRLSTVLTTGKFDNSKSNSRREAIMSVMVPEDAFVSELTIVYNGEEFHSRINRPQETSTNAPMVLDTGLYPTTSTTTTTSTPSFARSLELISLSSQDGRKMNLVKMRQDKHRILVKSTVEKGHNIKFRIKTEQVLKRRRFSYSHSIGVSMDAAKYEYTLMIEDDENLKRVGFGEASNEFFKESASVIQPGATSAGISHSWTPSDNNGLDPFAEMLTVSFDVAQASSSCDLAWAGEEKEFVSRCRVADDNIDRPVEAIFLLDTSTSMFGRKSQQAAKIISLMQANLRPTDRFNVARFDRELEFLDDEDLVANTKENREKALDFMIKPADGGGTDIYTAIVQALVKLLRSTSGYSLPNVFLITDGEATVGVTDPEVILNTVDYVRSSRGIHINTIHLGSQTYLTKNLAKLGNGLTTTIKEEDVELFSASEFFSNVIGNSLDHADWGVSDVSISFTDGVDKNSMTQLAFPKLVPGNELVIGGKLVGGGESIIRAEFNYTGLDGVKEGNFVKFWNQAAARSDSLRRPHWADFSSRTVANLEIQQLLEEWHDPSLSEDEKADLEEQIEERSLARNLLTPFTVLHVPKPALQEAMKSNLNGDDIDFDSIIFGRHRRNIEERLQYQDIKFRHAGKRQMPLAYEPVMCGTSTLLVTPNEENFNNFECSKTAEIKKQKMTINNSQIANVTLQFENENIEQIVVEADDMQIVIGKEGALKKEGDFMTSIGFGHSQDQKGEISWARFFNFVYVYFADHMVAVEILDGELRFEFGRRALTPRTWTPLPRPKSDLHCFGHMVSLSKC